MAFSWGSTFSMSRLQSPKTGSYSVDSERARNQAYGVGIRDELDFDDENRRERKKKKKKRRRGAMLAGVVDSGLMRRLWKLRLHVFIISIVLVVVVFEVRHLSQARPPPATSDLEVKLQVEHEEKRDEKQENKVEVMDTTKADRVSVEELDEEKQKNLDRLDMPMKKYKNGTEEPCLKLLPLEELKNVELPQASDSPLRILKYVREGRKQRTKESQNDPMTSGFAGYQTVEERAKSFELRDTMEVHCGFCEEGSGFDIDSIDKSFMNGCTIVVVTCTFGGGDDLYQPIGMAESSLSKVCYVALWDEITLKTQTDRGKAPDPVTRKVGLWRIVIVHNLPFSDQRRNGKIPKMLNHRLFPQARYSIWVDSKSQFRRDPIGVLEALLWRPKSVFAISLHGGRSCVYKEGIAIVQKHKAQPGEVSIQLNQYRSEGIPEGAQFHGHKALAEASIIVREHTPLTNLFMCLWFNEVMRFTARDQLSFPYVLLRLHVMVPNMFPVCTRHALVNSIGHKSKAKPLNILT
ncbi:hypothetical protein R1sor_006995 [Riccia sorocarpa]|uniref:TOD1/MUCI70 glycosyltransferase-like domain-containing protein n=1 Tax=Riccia sorocarpa TaxID=122646 RepID=A0ABD3HSN5_9MARC